MPNIRPVSDLRNYNEVLREISIGEPVFLTRNGRGRYAIMDIDEFEKTKATLRLLGELSKGEESVKKGGWLSYDDVARKVGLSDG